MAQSRWRQFVSFQLRPAARSQPARNLNTNITNRTVDARRTTAAASRRTPQTALACPVYCVWSLACRPECSQARRPARVPPT